MIHQFYFTHCTYASSALERKSGEVGPHPLGYSVRSASVQGPVLREIFRRLERYVYYYLPVDTPAPLKETATAADSPKRLLFLPETDFGPVLMQLVYRNRDTAGRIGSYFCHVLAGDENSIEKLAASGKKTPPSIPVQTGKNPNSVPLTMNSALQLWNVAGWVTQDEEWFPHDLEPFNSLQDVLKDAGTGIDERVLTSFLTTESGREFHDPHRIIPERWRKKPVSERQQIFKTILYGFLQVRDLKDANLLLVVEPAMAVLFFYGISQFFPQILSRLQSFSTYEPLPDRLFTKLAATTFQEPEKNDLNDVLYHSRSFVFNTWNARTSNFDAVQMQTSYVSHVWKQFLAGGVVQVKAFCNTLNSVGITSINDLQALMDVENVFHQIMVDGESDLSNLKPLPATLAELPLSSSRMAVTLLKRRIADGLTKIMAQPLQEAEKTLKNVIGTPGQLLLLELLGSGGNIPNVQNAVQFLIDSLPMEFLGQWLKTSQASDEYKGKLLEKWFLQLNTMPKGCEFLWKLSVSSIGTEKTDALAAKVPGPKPPVLNANVLPETLIRLPHDVLWKAFQSPNIVPFQKEMVLAFTLGVSRLMERDGAFNEAVMAIRKRLDHFIQEVPEMLFASIYRTYGNWFFLNYPGDSMFLGEKFVCLEEALFSKPTEITAKLEILFDIQDILPESVTPRIRRWSVLHKAMLPVTNFQAQSGRKMQVRALDQACESLAQAAYEVFDDVRFLAICGGPEAATYSRIGKINNAQRNRFVEQELSLLQILCRQWFSTELLPAGNRTHELMQKKLKYYFQTKEWKSGGASPLGNQLILLSILGGIAVGLLGILLLFVLSGREMNPTGTNPEDSTPSQFQEESEPEQTPSQKKQKSKSAKKSAQNVLKDETQEKTPPKESQEEVFVPRAGIGTEAENEELVEAEVLSEEVPSSDDGEIQEESNGENQEEAVTPPVKPQNTGILFEKTNPKQVERWKNQYAADGFSRTVSLNTKARKNYSREEQAPVVLTSTPIRDAGNFSKTEAAGLKLQFGYIFFEGTAYPFGGTEEQPNCVPAPNHVPKEGTEFAENSDSDSDSESGSASDQIPSVSKKHVLTEKKLATPRTNDEPGSLYHIPTLAQALGVEDVYVELGIIEETEEPVLQIHVQKKIADLQERQNIEDAQLRAEELSKEIVKLQTAIKNCESVGAKFTKEAEKVYSVLAELTGKTALLKNRYSVRKPETDEEIEEARKIREKIRSEKMPQILAAAQDRLERRIMELKEVQQNIPDQQNGWSEADEDSVRRLQGITLQKKIEPLNSRVFQFQNSTPETPKREAPTITAVFAGNFLYELPFPTSIQNLLQGKNVTDENDAFGNVLTEGFQEVPPDLEESKRIALMQSEEDFVLNQKQIKMKNRKLPGSCITLQVVPNTPVVSNLHITLQVRQIIPGEKSPKDLIVSEANLQSEPILLDENAERILISFQIKNREEMQNEKTAAKASVWVTPYFHIQLKDRQTAQSDDSDEEDSDEEKMESNSGVPKNFILKFKLENSFLTQFNPSKSSIKSKRSRLEKR